MRYLFFVLSVLPLPAVALSCTPYGVSDAYLDAARAEDGYVPVLGALSFDTESLPLADWGNQTDVSQTTLIPAAFKGDALSVRGISQPFEADVVLEVNCAGPWCPSPQPGEMLGFLRKTSHSYVLSVGACGGNLFSDPSAEQIQQLRDCLSGLACDALPLR